MLTAMTEETGEVTGSGRCARGWQKDGTTGVRRRV